MRIAILVSGRGSNMKALVENLDQTSAELVLVAADKACDGLDWADGRGYTTWCSAKPYQEKSLHEALIKAGVEMVFLAGFMRLLSKEFVSKWSGKIINIHPSLLPAFPGLETHARALAKGVKFHGCTVHYVDEGMDTGQIIDQAMVAVTKGDTAESLAAKVLKEEHRLYSTVLAGLAPKIAV